jgi:hypothetical protein
MSTGVKIVELILFAHIILEILTVEGKVIY